MKWNQERPLQIWSPTWKALLVYIIVLLLMNYLEAMQLIEPLIVILPN